MFFRFICIFSAIILATACTKYDSDFKLPGVYRIDIQQGNVVDQDMLDKLKPGMDRSQVRFILGTPAVEDPFHKDRWDYIYTNAKGGSDRKQRHIIVYFDNDKLDYVEGGVVPGMRTPEDEFKRKTTTVDVPLRKKRPTGILYRILSLLPFVGDEYEPPPPLPRDKDKKGHRGE